MVIETIDLREHVALSYALWLEDMMLPMMAGIQWEPLAGI